LMQHHVKAKSGLRVFSGYREGFQAKILLSRGAASNVLN